MKSLIDYISEAITTFDKPDKETAAKIDLVKIGKLIEQAGGKDANLIYTFRKGDSYTCYKIDAAGQLFETSEDKKTGSMKEWKRIKDIFKMFNTSSGRMIETRAFGISSGDVNGSELWGKKFIDEKASQKMAELLGVESLRIGVNNWRGMFNAMLKA